MAGNELMNVEEAGSIAILKERELNKCLLVEKCQVSGMGLSKSPFQRADKDTKGLMASSCARAILWLIPMSEIAADVSPYSRSLLCFPILQVLFQ